MRRRFSAQQRLAILEMRRDGAKISDLCLQYGFSKQTYYRWRSRYGWMLEPYATTENILEDEKRSLQKFIDIQGVDTKALMATLR